MEQKEKLSSEFLLLSVDVYIFFFSLPQKWFETLSRYDVVFQIIPKKKNEQKKPVSQHNL
jgi:hypothetical protein